MKVLFFVKKILKKVYKIVFKNKIKINELIEEKKRLEYQLEYMKHHFDIEQMKPATGWLRTYQLEDVAFVNEYIKILNKSDIHPFLDGGSLLGAIRHKGFIPFDDDIDTGLIREEYEKVKDYCKKNFIWYDTRNFEGDIVKTADELIRANPNKCIALETPFCIHIYHGTNIGNAKNLEFFVYDYVNENITEDQFLQYREFVKSKIQLHKNWSHIFDFYEQELKNNSIFSKTPTTRVTPGIGNFVLTQYNFYGFRQTEDLFPLIPLQFESYMLPCPKNPQNFVSKHYSSLGYPKDIGVAHNFEVLDKYLNTKGESINYREF